MAYILNKLEIADENTNKINTMLTGLKIAFSFKSVSYSFLKCYLRLHINNPSLLTQIYFSFSKKTLKKRCTDFIFRINILKIFFFMTIIIDRIQYFFISKSTKLSFSLNVHTGTKSQHFSPSSV